MTDRLHIEQEFAPHPFSEILPLIEGEEFEALVQSVTDNGLLQPIILFEGQILDGRNRYRACKAAQRPFYDGEVKTFGGNAAEALDYVEAQNLIRRQLSQSQRAMVASRLATLRNGMNAKNLDGETMSIDAAADRLNVSPFLVKQARRVRKDAAPNIVAMVERGEITLNMANKVAALPEAEQAALESGDAVRARMSPEERLPPGPKAGPRRITAAFVNRVLSDLTDLAEMPAHQAVSVLAAPDRAALAELLPRYQEFFESLRQAVAEGGECQAAG